MSDQTPCGITPPQAERYVIATRFAYRVAFGRASDAEISFMDRYLDMEVDFDVLFPDPDAYAKTETEVAKAWGR